MIVDGKKMERVGGKKRKQVIEARDKKMEMREKIRNLCCLSGGDTMKEIERG